MTKEELMIRNHPHGGVAHNTKEAFDAVIISHPSKGKRILLKQTRLSNTSQAALHQLFEQTCKMLSDMMLSDFK